MNESVQWKAQPTETESPLPLVMIGCQGTVNLSTLNQRLNVVNHTPFRPAFMLWRATPIRNTPVHFIQFHESQYQISSDLIDSLTPDLFGSSLMNRINQKGIRPQDQPVALSELTAVEQTLIRRHYPELFTSDPKTE